MAEAFLRQLAGDRFDVASAGTEASGVHPLARRVMEDIRVDMGGHTSKTPGSRGTTWSPYVKKRRSGVPHFLDGFRLYFGAFPIRRVRLAPRNSNSARSVR